MCKIASKKLVTRPLTVTTQKPAPLSLLGEPLQLQLISPPILDSTSTVSIASASNPSYFDMLPPLTTPHFTPSSLLLDPLDYSFPSPAVVMPAPSAPHYEQFITSTTSTTSSSDAQSGGSPSPFETSSDEENEYSHWAPHHSVVMGEILEEDKPLCLDAGVVDSSLIDEDQGDSAAGAKTLPGMKIVSMSSAPARTAAAKAGCVSKKTVTAYEKRERNRLAAERYRKKGRDTISYLDQQRGDLSQLNCELQQKNDQLEREVAFLKDTLAKHGLLLSTRGRC